VIRTKTGISKIYFVELPKDVQERFLPSPAKTVAAQRERQPIKVEAKQDESPKTDGGGLPTGLLISAGFIRLFFAVASVIITGVVLAFIRIVFSEKPMKCWEITADRLKEAGRRLGQGLSH
jgi:hypothetical protein